MYNQCITINLIIKLIIRRCQNHLERALQSTQFAQTASEEQLERAHVRIEELKVMNNKLNDQLTEEQQERHKYQNNTIAIDQERDTLKVFSLHYCAYKINCFHHTFNKILTPYN